MKHKTAELEGSLLDAAVAMAEGLPLTPRHDSRVSSWADGGATIGRGDGDLRSFSPSTRWGEGGPIMQREGIELHCIDRNGRRMGEWMSRHPSKLLPLRFGPTPLIAAMRAYVASKLGEEVELLR